MRPGKAAASRSTAPWATPAPWTIDQSRAAHRGAAARRLSVELLLQEMGAAAGEPAGRARPRRRRRDRSGPRFCVPAKPLKRKLNVADVPDFTDARLVRPAGASAGAICARRPRAHQKHPSGDAYAPAALCPRPSRRHRGAARLPRLSRHVPRSARAKIRNGSTPCCSRAANYGATMPSPRSKSRSRRSSPIWSRHEHLAAQRATQAVPSIPRNADGPVFRAPWEARSLCAGAAAPRTRPVHLEGMGGDARRGDQESASRRRSRHRRDLLSPLARDARTHRRRERPRRRGHAGDARATRGDARANARRTARRSSYARTISHIESSHWRNACQVRP